VEEFPWAELWARVTTTLSNADEPPEAAPIYDPTGIGLAVREAVTKFIGPPPVKTGK
jgi:hypothetical protein